MKALYIGNILFFISFFLISGSVHAQFPEDVGTVWEYAQPTGSADPFYPGPTPYYIDAFQDSIQKDTLINGTDYHKVIRTGQIMIWADPYWVGWVLIPHPIGGEWFFRMDNDTMLFLDTIIGSVNHDKVLLNFNLTAGDTFPTFPYDLLDMTDGAPGQWTCNDSLGSPHCFPPASIQNSVSGITALPCKRYSLMPPIWYSEALGILESWSNSIILNKLGYTYGLKQVRDTSGIIWSNDTIITRGDKIENPSVLKVKVYPNPIQDKIIINTNVQVHSIVVRDLSGRIVQRLDFIDHEAGRIEINAIDFPKGVLIIEVNSSHKSAFIKVFNPG